MVRYQLVTGKVSSPSLVDTSPLSYFIEQRRRGVASSESFHTRFECHTEFFCIRFVEVKLELTISQVQNFFLSFFRKSSETFQVQSLPEQSISRKPEGSDASKGCSAWCSLI